MGINRIKAFIEENKIRQAALAQACDYLPQSYLSSIVQGWQKVTPRMKKRLLEGLKRMGLSEVEIMHFAHLLETPHNGEKYVSK